MRAVTYHGTGDFRVDTHPDPAIEHPRDAILRVTSTAICGSDLHMYDGFIPEMKKGGYHRSRVHGRRRGCRR